MAGSLISGIVWYRRNSRVFSLAIVILLALALLLMVDCDSGPEAKKVVAPDVLAAPYYFSLADKAAVANLPDITFSRVDLFYSVSINSVAGAGLVVDASGDFGGGVLDPTAALQFDGDTPIIGTGWFDPLTVNPADNFSVLSNGDFFYLRLGGYAVVKFEVTKADCLAFDIRYAYQASQTSAGSVISDRVPYTSALPARYDFDSGDTLAVTDWHLGLVTEAVYIDSLGLTIPWPTVITNYSNETRIAIITARAFEDIFDVPGNVNWRDESAANRPLGYGKQFQVFDIATPDSIFIVQPDYVYIIEAGGKVYKLRFNAWNDGQVKFEYAAF